MKLDSYLTPCSNKNSSKWIKESNVRPKTIKLLDKNTWHSFGFGNYLLDLTPKAQGTKDKIDKLDFMKALRFCV